MTSDPLDSNGPPSRLDLSVAEQLAALLPPQFVGPLLSSHREMNENDGSRAVETSEESHAGVTAPVAELGSTIEESEWVTTTIRGSVYRLRRLRPSEVALRTVWRNVILFVVSATILMLMARMLLRP